MIDEELVDQVVAPALVLRTPGRTIRDVSAADVQAADGQPGSDECWCCGCRHDPAELVRVMQKGIHQKKWLRRPLRWLGRKLP